MVAIEAKNLFKRYRGLTAVDGVNLRVNTGEFIGFLGPNGAGKSTVIKMLCGLLKPTSGHMLVAGYDVRSQPVEVKRSIGVLQEEPALYDRLTAEEYLQFAGVMHGLSEIEASHRTTDLLAFLDLEHAKNKYIVDYSTGMKKKTALAAALIHAPSVLFLDEPFSGIDPASVRSIRKVLLHLQQKGSTIFFASHALMVVERLCTRFVIIDHGRVVGEGSLDELRARADSGHDASLEEVFMTLTDTRNEYNLLDWL